MSGLLFIDACVRRETSRTERLAKGLLEALGGDFETVVLETAGIKGLDSKDVAIRDEARVSGDFSHPMFDHAKRFIEADTVVIAAPFWESCFPSTLKSYLEAISVPRLTYRYNEQGIPVGNGHARVFYVTTRGGPVTDDRDLGYMVVSDTCRSCGATDVRILSASGLDIVGNDVEAIMDEALSRIPEVVGDQS